MRDDLTDADEATAAELAKAHKCYKRVAQAQQEQDWQLFDPGYEAWLQAMYERCNRDN